MRRPEIKLASIRAAIEKTLEAEKRTDAEVSVLLVNDSRMRELNRSYRNIDSSTDVLAFAMGEGEFSDLHPDLLGDVVISVNAADRQKDRAGHSLIDEIRYLAIHGTLHLLGYEDETVSGRARMRRRGRKYLKDSQRSGGEVP